MFIYILDHCFFMSGMPLIGPCTWCGVGRPMRELKSGRGNLVGRRLGEPKHCRPGSLASVRLPPRVPLFRSPPPHPSPSHCAPSLPPCLRRLGVLPPPSLSRAKSAHQVFPPPSLSCMPCESETEFAVFFFEIEFSKTNFNLFGYLMPTNFLQKILGVPLLDPPLSSWNVGTLQLHQPVQLYFR